MQIYRPLFKISQHNAYVVPPMAGFASELLSCCSKALEDESHPLHPPVQSMFERLAAQALEPKDLRAFLRLGNPLCCSALDLHFDAPKEDVNGVKKAIEDETASSNDASPVPAGKTKSICYLYSYFKTRFGVNSDRHTTNHHQQFAFEL